MTDDRVLNELAHIVGSHRVKMNVPLSGHCTFRVGGAADYMVYPKTSDELIKLILACGDKKFLILGNGSNVVFSDMGFRGIIISTSDLKNIAVSDNEITADAGASLSKVALTAYKNGLTGMEFSYGIPGSVGGAVFMNAGAYGREMADVIVETCCVDNSGQILHIKKEDSEFSYRKSIFMKKEYTVLNTKVKLDKGNSDTIKAEMDRLLSSRKEKQPLEYPSAGSVFKRPVGHYAGQLIEQAGLKGFSIGGAQVSEKHAGFIINKDNATCEDIKNLVEHIKNRVFERCGINLECEIRFIRE